jgi:hypothetical protein
MDKLNAISAVAGVPSDVADRKLCWRVAQRLDNARGVRVNRSRRTAAKAEALDDFAFTIRPAVADSRVDFDYALKLPGKVQITLLIGDTVVEVDLKRFFHRKIKMPGRAIISMC